MTRDEIREWVARSRAEQGLPPTLTDPGQLERLAILFDTEPERKAS